MKRTNVDFVGKKKAFFGVTIGLILIGILFLCIFGLKMDIQFTGGAIASYTFTGEIDQNTVDQVVEEVVGQDVSIQISKDVMIAGSSEKQSSISLSFSGNQALTLEKQKELTSSLEEKFPDNNIKQNETTSVDPTMGGEFLLKCIVAVAIAAVLMIVYIAFRFRKIGGWSAGVMAVIALLIDVSMVFFTFVIARMPLDDNFIAAALTILGYSLNDTIIIYDRIRENRKLLGPKTEVGEMVNTSINQNLGRTINTSVCTFLAIAIVYIVSVVYQLDSVASFALPMMVGIVSGCYTSTFLVGPLWATWIRFKRNKKEQKVKA